MAGMLPLRVNDLKQYEYCPRIVFFNTVQPVERKVSVKMRRGQEVELRIEALEARRSLRRYGLAQGERESRVWLKAPQLGLSGQIDLLIRSGDEAFPVDFKYTRDRPRANHRLQLAAYALLIEEALQLPVRMGFLYLVPLQQLVRVPITDVLKQRCRDRMSEIREMIEGQWMPDPTPVRERCSDCEFRNYCGDIF